MLTRKKLASNGSQIHSELEATECGGDQSKKFHPGDIAWIRTCDGSWWPGQVVDEGSVRFKPQKEAKNEVLVRMYGCYEYLYVDPVCSAEFENYCKKENLGIREAFQNALNKDLSHLRSGGTLKRNVFYSRGIDAPIGKKQKQETTETCEIDGSHPGASSGEAEEVRELENSKIERSVKATRAKKPKQEETTKSKERMTTRNGASKDHSTVEGESNGASKVTPRRVSSRLKKTPPSGACREPRTDDVGNESSKIDQNQGVLGKANITEKAKIGTSRGKNSKQSGTLNTKHEDVEQTPTKSSYTVKSNAPEEPTSILSERRMKVMQSLGLIAPLGSPYKHKGFVIASPY